MQVNLIIKPNSEHREEVIDGKKVKVTYYSLESHVGRDGVRVRVVTRKIGVKGNHYFMSIMKF